MSTRDPYGDRRRYHYAAHFSDRGASALCFKRPRAINWKVAKWTIDWRAVTCRKCLRLRAAEAEPAGEP